MEEYLLGVPGIKTTPVANASEIIYVHLNIDVRKIIALVIQFSENNFVVVGSK